VTDPFAPPEDVRTGAGASGVAAGWMLAFGALGSAIGSVLVIVGAAGHIAVAAVPLAVVGAVVGMLAHRVEFARASGRTAVIDARGRAVQPLGTWLVAVPLAIGAASLLALVVVGSVYSQSRGIGAGFLLLSMGLAALFRPLYATSRLRGAVEAASRGEQRAEAELTTLAAAWWSPKNARAQAALNLGLLALRRREFDRAARWYAMVQSGRAAGFAATGLALVYVGLERFEEAEGALREAATSAAGRHIQGELDGVRLLLVLRRDGHVDALELAGRLAPPAPGALYTGALAAALVSAGRDDEAMTLMEDGGAAALETSGLAHLLPELDGAVGARV
jgi:tetratricopeptide (TPR) repeat protein